MWNWRGTTTCLLVLPSPPTLLLFEGLSAGPSTQRAAPPPSCRRGLLRQPAPSASELAGAPPELLASVPRSPSRVSRAQSRHAARTERAQKFSVDCNQRPVPGSTATDVGILDIAKRSRGWD